jgi:hypothetical protein
MKPMEIEEFLAVRESIQDRAIALMKHEKKEFATIGTGNIFPYKIGDRDFFSVESNVFHHIMERYLLIAQQKHQDKFGTGNAMDIIEALHSVEPVLSLTQYPDFLRTEQFAYVFEFSNGKVSGKVLRIDLFRHLRDKEGRFEFVGGVFHVFKHFSVRGINLSTGNDKNDIAHPIKLIELTIRAFFLEPGTHETATRYISYVNLNDKYQLKFIFYLEEQTQTYFVETIFKNKIKLG